MENEPDFVDSVLVQEIDFDDLPQEFQDSLSTQVREIDIPIEDFWANSEFNPLD